MRIALAEAEFRLAVAEDTEPAEAIDRLRAAIEQDPFCPKLFLHLGRLLHRSGGAVAAVPEYRHAIRLAPNSRRAHLLLALALLDIGKHTRELGDRVLAGLNSGSPQDLKAAVAEVDSWLEDQGTPGGDRKSRRPAPNRGVQGAPAAWRVALHEQITRGKTQASQLSALLQAGLLRVGEAGEVGEYATACALLLANGQKPRSVREFAKPVMAGHSDHPAVRMLAAALDLAEAGGPAAFVTTAAEHVENGTLPLELVCCLHLDRYGPDHHSSAVEALALLDTYPRALRDSDGFDELRLAVLDGHARKAWAAERFDEARLLWQEAGSIDRFRVPVALNLALLAAKTKSEQDYGPAWDRASELLYLHAAGAGDVQLLLEERRSLHSALTQQAHQRHCERTGLRDTPSAEEITAWMADPDALTEWLHQWDLHYVNARLGFRSPAHLLGVPADAGQEDHVAAEEAFVKHLRLALSGRDWAGVGVFATLAAGQARRARLSIGETRDAYYEPERQEARSLAELALRRGLILREMMKELHRRPSGAQLRMGYELARRQLVLPWRALRPICVAIGAIADDFDLVRMFEQDLVALATYWDTPKPRTDEESADRLSLLDGCVEVVPHDLTLRLMRCLALRAVNRHDDAYAAAVAALELPPPQDEDDNRQATVDELVALVDLIGMEGIPRSLPSREAAIAAARRELERFPRCGQLRRELVKQLSATGRVAETNEAIALLSEGIELALSAGQRADFTERLVALEPVAAAAPVRASLRQLVEPAQEAASAAIAEYVRDTGDETRKSALTAVRVAVDKVTEGLRIAEQAGLDAERASLDKALARLREMAARLAGEPEDAGR
ncbi:hypothetical protein AB0A63_34565 [Lentzea sp. NPDC042327]|uniref:hypothetical protein n=1 Tax=Lentzea sp. NPDC042327 TaxID=3154801 RepID=UPI0033E64E4C